MSLRNTVLSYAFLIIMSTGKKNFENLGRIARKSGDTVRRLLPDEKNALKAIQGISHTLFSKSKKLYIIIDDTLIKKIYAENMQGSGYFFDQKIGRRITAFRLVVGMISDGKHSLPICNDYLIDKELSDALSEKKKTATDVAKELVEQLLKLFQNKKMHVVVDGLYATKDFVKWCIENGIKAEMRMHSNRVVEYKGERIQLKKLLTMKGIRPKHRQMARTITVSWHTMELEITVVRRIDKHDVETIVFQVSTFKAEPRDHVAIYQCRWPIEMCFRTAKQSLGLQDCLSSSFQVQRNHVMAVFLSYALAQLEKKRLKLKNPEAAINRLELKNEILLQQQFSWILQDYPTGLA